MKYFKETIAFVICLTAVTVGLYGMVVLITWDINIATWPTWARVVFALPETWAIYRFVMFYLHNINK